MSKKKVLVSGYIGFLNFGDDVMLEVLINHLKEIGCDIRCFSSRPKLTKETFDVGSVYYKNIFSLIFSLLRTKVLVFSGGNLLQNETSTFSLMYYLFIIFIAKLFMKKVVFYSNGIGPIYGKIPNFLVFLALKTADFISVRDIYSLQYLSDIKVQGELSSDGIWEYKTPKYEPKDIIGVQVRNYKNTSPQLYELIAKNISSKLKGYEVKIISLQDSHDIDECIKFKEVLSSVDSTIKSSIVNYKTPSQLSKEFSNLRYLVGMRYHANILGLKLGVKILPLSYSSKVKNFSKDFDIKYVDAANPNNFDEAFSELISEFYQHRHVSRHYEWRNIDKVINS